jgi:adenylyltransferase/sulfurtransferase
MRREPAAFRVLESKPDFRASAVREDEDAMATTARRGLLSDEQMERYARQIILDEVGVAGQRRLIDSKVLVVGAGGLGSPVLLYLAAAGIGTLGVVDGDRVDLTNLQRQILHYTHDVGRPKTQSARRTLEDINPAITIIPHQTVLVSDNALEIIGGYDLVINGSDNFPTRYLVNDACVFLGKPLIDASILKWEGQATVFLPGRGCYRCLFPTPPPPGAVPSCAEGGIIGAVAGFMGSLQALEAVKVLLGRDDTLANRLLIFDALSTEVRTLRWNRNPACPVCGDRPTITALIDYEAFCGLPGRNGHAAVTEPAERVPAGTAEAPRDISPEAAQALLERGEATLVDVREPWEWVTARIPGATLIPLGEMDRRMGELASDRPVIFYCAVGQRSAAAADALRARGARAFNIAGGIVAWMNGQYPVEAGPTP